MVGKKGNKMDFIQALQLLIGSSGLLGIIILIFKFGGLVEKINSFQEKFESIEKKLTNIDTKLDTISADIRQLDARVSHIEGYLMGRDIRNGTEEIYSK